MWFTNKNDYLLTLQAVVLAQPNLLIPNLLDTFGVLRALTQDNELKQIVITLYDGS